MHTPQLPAAEYASFPIAGVRVDWSLQHSPEPVNPNQVVQLLFGLGSNAWAYQDMAQHLARRGYHTALTQLPRWQPLRAALHPRYIARPAALTSQCYYGTTRELRRQFDGIHLVGHSYGGPLAVATALRRPDAIRSVTTINGAGENEHSLLSMVRPAAECVIKKISEREDPGKLIRWGGEIVKHVAQNAPLFVHEMLEAGSADVYEGMATLGELGIPTAQILSERDLMFPASLAQRRLAGVVTRSLVLPGDHFLPQNHPAQAAEAIATILDELPAGPQLDLHTIPLTG